MKIFNFKDLIIKNRPSNDDQLLDLYLEAVEKEPKPETMSKSLYLTCLALWAFEKIGNKFPTQKEIDAVERAFKRYSRRKSVNTLAVMAA
ncbi:MAG TPA: hypothetical protein VHE99_06100 [Gammaproteobacteria bacterium]|nr:hypothetical protein [Gammaproteobacteria bacterium]